MEDKIKACVLYWQFRESKRDIPSSVILDYVKCQDEVLRHLLALLAKEHHHVASTIPVGSHQGHSETG